jgi:5-formyltetrahydrofolate cyclo-ligase
MDAVAAADCVAGYLAFDGEPDIRFCLTQLCRRGVRVVLPVVPASADEDLHFRRWTPATPLAVNRFGVSEPRGGEDIPLDRVDTMLLPLVAFDRRGTRLGMGAGWYDRILGRPEYRATRIGVAWSRQEAPMIPLDDWDQPLDAVVTEREWFTCSP